MTSERLSQLRNQSLHVGLTRAEEEELLEAVRVLKFKLARAEEKMPDTSIPVAVIRAALPKIENLDDCGPYGEGWQSEELWLSG